MNVPAAFRCIFLLYIHLAGWICSCASFSVRSSTRTQLERFYDYCWTQGQAGGWCLINWLHGCPPGSTGNTGISGLAAGPGEREQESNPTGQAHRLQVGGGRQGGLRVGLVQQLGHQDPPQQEVLGPSHIPSSGSCGCVGVTHARLSSQSEELCCHCGPAGGGAPVQVLCGRAVDVGSQRGEWQLVCLLYNTCEWRNVHVVMLVLNVGWPTRPWWRQRPGWSTTSLRWREPTLRCLMPSGLTHRILQTCQVRPLGLTHE